MSGHRITMPMQGRYDGLCADLVGVLERIAAHVDARPVEGWETCLGCGTSQDPDQRCTVCPSRVAGPRRTPEIATTEESIE